MSAFAFKTVVVKGDGIRKEGKLSGLSADITPGCLVTSSGENFDTVGIAGAGVTRPAFAVENEVMGEDIDTAYDTEGERVLYHVLPPGAEVFAWLKAGETVAVGGELEAVASGLLAAKNAATAVAIAMETIDNSAGLTAVRILAEVK